MFQFDSLCLNFRNVKNNVFIKLKIFFLNIFYSKLLTKMQRKTKFGFKICEITFKKNESKKNENKEKDSKLIECNLCLGYNSKNMIKYVNCKLKGTKNEKIGYYKDCDTALCLDCKGKIENIFNKGDIVMYRYEKKIRNIKKTTYNTGKVLFIEDSDYYNIYCTKSESFIRIKRKNILYKLNTCPWCRSHRLHDWHKNTKKFPKKKRCSL